MNTTFPRYDGFESGGDRQEPRQNEGWKNQGEKKPWNGEKKKWSGGGGQRGGFKPPEETDMSLYLPYAATSEKNLPESVIPLAQKLAKMLDEKGFTARVGAMGGLEDVVELATTHHELILPWRGFADRESKLTFTRERAKAVARMFHPSYDSMKEVVQTFLAKNARLILGNTMASPALFLLTWTEDGIRSIKQKTPKTGFSAHPIAIASALGIPIFNLGDPNCENQLVQYLASLQLPTIQEGASS